MRPALPSPDRPPLDYAPPLPWRKTPAARRVLIIFALGVVAILAWLTAPELWLRSRAQHWWTRCVRFMPPAGTIAFSQPKKISYSPREWIEFEAILGPGGVDSPVAFLHELRSPKGNRRLVCLEIEMDRILPSGSSNSTPFLTLSARVFQPGSLARRPIERLGAGGITIDRPDEVLFGNVDPLDPSHFSIRTSSGDREIIYDGWLRNDDTVLIEQRITLTTSPAAALERAEAPPGGQ